MDWAKWPSGDCLYALDAEILTLDQTEVLRRVALGFQRVVID